MVGLNPFLFIGGRSEPSYRKADPLYTIRESDADYLYDAELSNGYGIVSGRECDTGRTRTG